MTEELIEDQTEPAPDARSRSAPIIERAPLPIVEVEGQAHIVSYVNAAFCRLLGKSRGELIGRSFAEIVQGGDKCLPLLDKVFETGEAATLSHEDDSEPAPAYWLYAMWPALDAKERPAGVIIQLTKAAKLRQTAAAINEALLIAGLHQHELREAAEKSNAQLQVEIAERKLAQAALQEAKHRLAGQAEELERVVTQRTEKLRETVGELEAFSYSIAHDLRAPLRAMHGYSNILLDEYGDRLDEMGRSHLERIARSAGRLDILIQDVLSYTQIVRVKAPMEPVDLDRLLRDIMESYPDWQPPKAEIQIEGTLPNVFGNEALLGQCVSNLLSNAVKFVSPDTRPRVRIWAEPVNGQIRLWFEDNGIGIAPEDHGRIFRMFEQINPPGQFDGTGIGLTIVRKAVEQMGGRAGFESELGKGSKFWIEFQKVTGP